MKRKIADYELVDYGLEHSQYHTGLGTYGTDFDDAFVGVGLSQKEAFEDAIGQAINSGYEISPALEAEENDYSGEESVGVKVDVIIPKNKKPEIYAEAALVVSNGDINVVNIDDEIRATGYALSVSDFIESLIDDADISKENQAILEKEARSIDDGNEHYYYVHLLVKAADEQEESIKIEGSKKYVDPTARGAFTSSGGKFLSDKEIESGYEHILNKDNKVKIEFKPSGFSGYIEIQFPENVKKNQKIAASGDYDDEDLFPEDMVDSFIIYDTDKGGIAFDKWYPKNVAMYLAKMIYDEAKPEAQAAIAKQFPELAESIQSDESELRKARQQVVDTEDEKEIERLEKRIAELKKKLGHDKPGASMRGDQSALEMESVANEVTLNGEKFPSLEKAREAANKMITQDKKANVELVVKSGGKDKYRMTNKGGKLMAERCNQLQKEAEEKKDDILNRSLTPDEARKARIAKLRKFRKAGDNLKKKVELNPKSQKKLDKAMVDIEKQFGKKKTDSNGLVEVEKFGTKINAHKARLRGSAPTLERLKKLIGEYLYSDNIELEQINDKTWSVKNSGRMLPYFQVQFKNGRYRFMELPEFLESLGREKNDLMHKVNQIKENFKDDKEEIIQDIVDKEGNKLLKEFLKKYDIEDVIKSYEDDPHPDFGDVKDDYIKGVDYIFGNRELSAYTPNGYLYHWIVNNYGGGWTFELDSVTDENGKEIEEGANMNESEDKFKKLDDLQMQVRELLNKGDDASFQKAKELQKEVTKLMDELYTIKKMGEASQIKEGFDFEGSKEEIIADLIKEKDFAEFGEEIAETFEIVDDRLGLGEELARFEADGKEYWLLKDEDQAYDLAVRYAALMLEDEPELFNKDFLQNHIYITDTDRRIIAGEEADSRLESMDDEDMIREAGLEDEYEKWDELYQNTSNETVKREAEQKKKELVDQAKRELEEKYYDEIYEALKDPIQYFVHALGAYTIEDLMKANFINIDVESAAKEAVDLDSWAHFLPMSSGYYKTTSKGYIYFEE